MVRRSTTNAWSLREVVSAVCIRLGLAIWSTEDRNVGWDGRKDGAEPVIDVYVWKVIVERDGDARDFIGHVTLLR